MFIGIQILANTLIFIIGLSGVLVNYNNFLLALLGIEVALLGVSLNFIIFGLYYLSMEGPIYALFLLAIAACEAAVGLAILIISYKVRGTTYISDPTIFR